MKHNGGGVLKTGSILGHEWGTLFVPELLLATQYFQQTRRHQTDLMPERRLLVAVLEDALHVLQTRAGRHDSRARLLCAEVLEWVARDHDGGLYSFRSICDHLGLDAAYWRRGVAALLAHIRDRSTLTLLTTPWTGTRLKPWRLAHHLTQHDVADAVDVAPGVVSAWESGTYRIAAMHWPRLDALAARPGVGEGAA